MKIQQIIIFIIFACISDVAIGQTNYDYFIEGRVFDKTSKEPIPYANIYNKSTENGTISNLDGYFKIRIESHYDTIIVTFVGYKKMRLHLIDQPSLLMLYLEENNRLLSEVTIIGRDNSYLVDLILDCKKNQPKKKTIAKTYYELKSFVDSSQVELVECFYNGISIGYDIKTLELKTGRIALRPFNDRFFVSMESSMAITNLKLFDHNDYFPTNPLELSKRELKRKYYLDLVEMYEDENFDSIFVLKCSPKRASSEFFTTHIWVDFTKKNILKINLSCEDASTHPFIPLFHSDTIKKVDFNITKSFKEVNGSMVFQHVDFKYDLAYKSRDSSIYSISANAVLYSYNFDSVFYLPKFIFSDPNIGEYKKINAFPINNFFWENNRELKLNNQEDENSLFFTNLNSLTHETLFSKNNYLEQRLLENEYVIWSQNRIRFREFIPESETKETTDAIADPEQFNLDAKLFLDVNSYYDTIQIVTAAIFDPYESYFKSTINDLTLCLIFIST